MGTDLLIVAVLLVLSACFEGAEAAFLSISEVRLQTLIRKGHKTAALVGKLKTNVRLLLGTLLLGQTATDVASASIATAAATKLYGDAGIGIVTGLLTLVILVFVNLIPKSHAANHPEWWSLFFARPAYLLMVVFRPIVNVIDRFVLLFVRGEKIPTHVSEEEIKTMTIMGVNAGTVESGEKDLIDRVFLFNDITAEDVMTPRQNMFMLDGTKSLAEIMPAVNVSKYSRFPIYEGDRNNIVGIVHIKDVLEKIFAADIAPDNILVRDIAVAPLIIHQTKLIDELFREFQRKHVHMGIVINEYGTVVGLVTLEDLIEELVGEISDESDIDEHTIKRVDKHTVLVHGDVKVQYINRFFNTHIDAPENKTVSWVILEKLGGVPTEGQKIGIEQGLDATVEQMDKRRIMKVRLVKGEEHSSVLSGPA